MSSSSIAFIDRRVHGADTLVASLRDGTQCHFLDIDVDGIEQIRKALVGLTDLASVQV
jgi:hypothetical protein